MSPRQQSDFGGEAIDDEVLREAMQEARTRVAGIRRFHQIAQVVTGLVLLAALLWLIDYRNRAMASIWSWSLWFVLGIGLLGLIHWAATAKLRRRYLREALNRRGVRVCVQCGYSLRGLSPQADRCPECGAVADHRF